MEPKEPKKKVTIKLRKRAVREKPEPAQEAKAKPARGKSAVKAKVSRFRPKRKAPLPGVVDGMSGDIPTVGPASKPEKSRVSPELLDMLAKLSTWEPKSDAAVLEAANRLAQAAREKIDYPKEEPGDVLENAMWACAKLVGRVLVRDNGVSQEYDYVTGVTRDDPGNAVEISTVHLFHRDRVGEMAVGCRTINVPAGKVIVEDPGVSGRVTRKKPGCPVPGYDVDTGRCPLVPLVRSEIARIAEAFAPLMEEPE